MKKIRVYGLTGNIGCGKSTIAKMMGEFGFQAIDSDAIAKKILLSTEARPKIREIFGDSIFDGNNLDLRKMAIVFFENLKVKEEWEHWVFPRVLKQIEEEISRIERSNPAALAVVESALIYEAGWEKRFDAVIVAKCPYEEQVRRLINHRRISLLEIEERLAHQLPSEEKEEKADYIIDTDCSLELLADQVRNLCFCLKNKPRF